MDKSLSKKEIKDLLIRTKSLITLDEACFLYKNIKNIKGDILEIGTYKGGTTILMSKALKHHYNVYSIDPHNLYKVFKKKIMLGKEIMNQDTLKVLKMNIKKEKAKNIIYYIDSSDNISKFWNKTISLLFIDGDHDYYQVKKDFFMFEPFLLKGGLIIFHDTRTSKSDSPVKGDRLIIEKGPYKFSKEFMNNKRFDNFFIIDTMLIATKKIEANYIVSIFNKIRIYYITFLKFIRPLSTRLPEKIDRYIGEIGISINNLSPKLYYYLRKMKEK